MIVAGEEGVSEMRSTEAATLVTIRLCNIPKKKKIIWENVTYEFRGIVSFIAGKSNLQNSVGHYKAYIKRGNRNWEVHDDLKKRRFQLRKQNEYYASILFTLSNLVLFIDKKY